MTISSDTTTDLEPTALVRDDTFWRSDHDQAPQDWLGYLGLENDPEGPMLEGPTVATPAPASANLFDALAPSTDDLLPGR